MIDKQYLEQRIEELRQKALFSVEMWGSTTGPKPDWKNMSELDMRGFVSVYRAYVELIANLRLYNERFPNECDCSRKFEKQLDEYSQKLEDNLITLITNRGKKK